MKATKVTPEEGRDQDREPRTEEAQHVRIARRDGRTTATVPDPIVP